MRFHVFRILLTTEPNLFGSVSLQRDVALRHVLSQPKDGLGRGKSKWMICNWVDLDHYGGNFQVGREAHRIVTRHNAQDARFEQQPDVLAHAAHCVIDTSTGILCIEENQKLSGTPLSTARAIARLTRDTLLTEHDFQIGIAPLLDPTPLLDEIRDSHRVVGLRARVARPNPLDADEHFVKPTQKVVDVLGGTHATVDVKGARLRKDAVEAVVRSAAVIGYPAAASYFRTDQSTKVSRRKLGDTTLTIEWEELTSEGQLHGLLEYMRERVRSLRDPSSS